MAFDSRTGELLWRFQTGAEIHASPISYEVGGRQYVALAAGQNLLSFALPASEPVKKSHREGAKTAKDLKGF